MTRTPETILEDLLDLESWFYNSPDYLYRDQLKAFMDKKDYLILIYKLMVKNETKLDLEGAQVGKK